MRSFRFIHAADLHLDCPFKGLTGLPERLRSDIRDSTFAALDRLVELALRERVHFVLFAGDIYEAKDRSLRAQLRFQQALEALAAAGIPAFIIHGNHDPLLEGYTAKLRLPGGVRVFGCEAVESALVYAEDGQPLARISGISFDRAAVTDNLTPAMPTGGTDCFISDCYIRMWTATGSTAITRPAVWPICLGGASIIGRLAISIRGVFFTSGLGSFTRATCRAVISGKPGRAAVMSCACPSRGRRSRRSMRLTYGDGRKARCRSRAWIRNNS